MPKDAEEPRTRTPRLRKPVARDGAEIWELVRRCKPLDENSMYCNLVQAEHFRDTCVIAEDPDTGALLGWISGHLIPGAGALFVWQVAVSPEGRGQGLGCRMLAELVSRPECGDAQEMRTTITRDNQASWALFRSFARNIGGTLNEAPHFERDVHFDGRHATEHLVTISLPAERSTKRAA